MQHNIFKVWVCIKKLFFASEIFVSWFCHNLLCLINIIPYLSVESPWTQWTFVHRLCPPGKLEHWSMDNFQEVHCQWTVSIESMDNVHWVHGQCPVSPWTMSRESMDFVPESMDFVPGFFPYTIFRIWFHKIKNQTELCIHPVHSAYVVYFSWHAVPTCHNH